MSGDAERRIVMVESQLRPNGITDRGLIAAMGTIPRERFVPEHLRGVAYMDSEIEVFPAEEAVPSRALLSPLVQARLIQLASVGPQDRVLDLGCATGYSSAILAQQASHIVGLEPMPQLRNAAIANLGALQIRNVEVVADDLDTLPASEGPYDVIVVEGSVPQVPDGLRDRLNVGGRLVAVITPASNMRQGKAYLFIRTNGETSGVAQFDASASPLPGFADARSFVFAAR